MGNAESQTPPAPPPAPPPHRKSSSSPSRNSTKSNRAPNTSEEQKVISPDTPQSDVESITNGTTKLKPRDIVNIRRESLRKLQGGDPPPPHSSTSSSSSSSVGTNSTDNVYLDGKSDVPNSGWGFVCQITDPLMTCQRQSTTGLSPTGPNATHSRDRINGAKALRGKSKSERERIIEKTAASPIAVRKPLYSSSGNMPRGTATADYDTLNISVPIIPGKGIGLVLTAWEDAPPSQTGKLFVKGFKNMDDCSKGSAELSGVKVGDIIEKVNGIGTSPLHNNNDDNSNNINDTITDNGNSDKVDATEVLINAIKQSQNSILFTINRKKKTKAEK